MTWQPRSKAVTSSVTRLADGFWHSSKPSCCFLFCFLLPSTSLAAGRVRGMPDESNCRIWYPDWKLVVRGAPYPFDRWRRVELVCVGMGNDPLHDLGEGLLPSNGKCCASTGSLSMEDALPHDILVRIQASPRAESNHILLNTDQRSQSAILMSVVQTDRTNTRSPSENLLPRQLCNGRVWTVARLDR